MESAATAEHLKALEEGMWKDDGEHLASVLAEEFSDFCRFGHVYDRDDLIKAPADGPKVEVEFPFEDFEVELLAPSVALITYVNTVVKDGDRQRARRTSVWVDSDNGWKLRHMQATTLN